MSNECFTITVRALGNVNDTPQWPIVMVSWCRSLPQHYLRDADLQLRYHSIAINGFIVPTLVL